MTKMFYYEKGDFEDRDNKLRLAQDKLTEIEEELSSEKVSRRKSYQSAQKQKVKPV